MSKPLNILMATEKEEDCGDIVGRLNQSGFEPKVVSFRNEKELYDRLNQGIWHVVLLCCHRNPKTTLAILRQVKKARPILPVMVISFISGEENAVAMMKAGASDYIMAQNMVMLVPAIQRELKQAEIYHERVLVQDRLAKSEERFRVAIKGSPIIVVSLDKKLCFTWLYNAQPELRNAAGRKLSQIIPTKEVKQIEQKNRSVIKTGESQRYIGVIKISAVDRVYDIKTEALKDQRGKIIGSISALMDITDMIATEKELRLRNQKLERLNKIMVGRELMMRKLKKQIEKIKQNNEH